MDMLDKIARLSKLEYSGEEKAKLAGDFQRMLDFVAKLQEVDTEGVEPLIHITEEVNRLQAEEAKATVGEKEILRNAPQKEGSFFSVPKVIES